MSVHAFISITNNFLLGLQPEDRHGVAGEGVLEAGAFTLIVLVTGATFVGSVSEFSSVAFSEVSTVAWAGPWTVLTPLSLMSVDSSDLDVLTTFRMTSPVSLAAAGGGVERFQHGRRDVVDELAVEVAFDGLAGRPRCGCRTSGRSRWSRARSLPDEAAHLDGVPLVAPAAEVPPALAVLVADVEEDQEALGAAELAGLEGVGVIGPGLVARDGPDVLGRAVLAQHAVLRLASRRRAASSPWCRRRSRRRRASCRPWSL